MSADGDWTLFIADISGGDIAELTGWTLSFTGTAIPEPSGCLLATAGLALLLHRRRQNTPVG
jgi:subtilisin-like proprotein convertase family protein